MFTLPHSTRILTSLIRSLTPSPLRILRPFSTSTMSWMDSWSRPSKSQSTPAPFYLLPNGSSTPYCHTCGRVISTRKSHASNASSTPAKYCSSRCRNRKPVKIDREIESAFVRFLRGEEDVQGGVGKGEAGGKKKSAGKKVKGETRVLVPCDVVEKFVFGREDDPEKVFGRNKNRRRRGVQEKDEWKSVDMVSGDERAASEEEDEGSAEDDYVEVVDGDILARLSIRSGTRIRPSQDVSEVNGSVGGEKGVAERIEETEEMLEKRREGQKRAGEREMVRCAARRGVAFGFVVREKKDGEEEERRKCEALMLGKVVEPSFAKGNWSIRWRE